MEDATDRSGPGASNGSVIERIVDLHDDLDAGNFSFEYN